jgi:rhamnulokinase
VNQPVITEQALRYNFTNEGGTGGQFRLLKNIMGLWLIQECRRRWAAQDGETTPYANLLALAERAQPFATLINPDDPSFLHPDDMPAALLAYARRTNQPMVPDRGAIMRCILESLALKYRYTIDQLESLLTRRLDVVHVVGGGSQNALLCQFTADACNKPVLAGPVEATAIGNLIVQMVALGELGSMDDARAVVRRSFPPVAYEPHDAAAWQSAHQRFAALQ